MWNLSQLCLAAASRGELGDPAEEGEEGRVLEALWQGGPGTHLGPADRQQSPGAPVGWAPALGSSPGGCRNEGSEQGLQPFPAPRHQTCPLHTYCCKETPNCWLGSGGRGGMGLGAVAGLFCVDFRKSSYLGEQMRRSGPLPGSVLSMATLVCQALTVLFYMDYFIRSS